MVRLKNYHLTARQLLSNIFKYLTLSVFYKTCNLKVAAEPHTGEWILTVFHYVKKHQCPILYVTVSLFWSSFHITGLINALPAQPAAANRRCASD